MVCDTSSSHRRFITWTNRRSRWPGWAIRSSGGCMSSAARLLFTIGCLDAIADGQQTQPKSLLDGAPQAARQDEGEQGRGGSEAHQVPGSALREGGLDREQEDRADDRALERPEAADQDH